MTINRCAHVAIATAVLALAIVMAPDCALADTSSIGRNLGNEVKALATGLFLGVAALVGIPVLLRRDFSEGIRLLVLVVVVGAFVFATGAVRQVIADLWRSLAF